MTAGCAKAVVLDFLMERADEGAATMDDIKVPCWKRCIPCGGAG